MYHQILKETQLNNTELIAVSKTKPVSEIKEIYNLGQRHFAENRVQDLCDKYEEMPKDIKWHLIGHLQTNKVKYVVPFVHLIQSVDSLKLLNEISSEAEKIFRNVNVLLQFHIATEDTKFGLNLTEAHELLEYYTANKATYQYVNICGVMGMASFTNNQSQIAEEFQQLKNIFQILKDTYFPFKDKFKEISMGMSGDYKLAMANGSTMVRIGSLIFGERQSNR
jgi:PLP dependent protein